jgi:hypothetical protein
LSLVHWPGSLVHLAHPSSSRPPGSTELDKISGQHLAPVGQQDVVQLRVRVRLIVRPTPQVPCQIAQARIARPVEAQTDVYQPTWLLDQVCQDGRGQRVHGEYERGSVDHIPTSGFLVTNTSVVDDGVKFAELIIHFCRKYLRLFDAGCQETLGSRHSCHGLFIALGVARMKGDDVALLHKNLYGHLN